MLNANKDPGLHKFISKALTFFFSLSKNNLEARERSLFQQSLSLTSKLVWWEMKNSMLKTRQEKGVHVFLYSISVSFCTCHCPGA